MLHDISLDRWQDYVESHPESTAFHHRRWLELLAEMYDLPVRILATCRGGAVTAGIPFLESRNLWGRRKLTSLPFTDCMRVLADGPQEQSDFYRGLASVDFRDYSNVTMRTDRPRDGSNGNGVVRHEIDTRGAFEDLERNFDKSLRRNVGKANRAKLQFSQQTDATSLSQFYDLHVQTRRKLGIPVQPRRFFDNLYEKIIATGLGSVGMVTRDGCPVSAGVLLHYNHSVIYKYAASDRRALADRPNDFLVYHAIRHAVEQGHATFDFGTSRVVEEGLRRFKRKWGANEFTMHNDCIFGAVVPVRDESRMMKMTRMVIRRSPRFVCRGLGEMLYRYSA